jgi:hypothetical protein
MSFFGKLFGTEAALNSVVKGVTEGLDALVYTDEEKAQAGAKERTEARSMVVNWMAATQGQNLARRLIALSITGVWLLMYITSVIASIISLFIDSVLTSEKMTKVSEITLSSAEDMNPAVMLILAFYFAAPHMGDIAKAVTSRFKGKIDK